MNKVIHLFYKIMLILAFLLYTASQTAAVIQPEYDLDDCKQISPSIINDLSDFTHLVDMIVVDSIVAEHYVLDPSFRQAFNYVKSSDFMRFLDELQNVTEVRDILDYLQILVPCAGFELDVDQLEIVLLEAMQQEEHRRYHRQRRSVDVPSGSNSLSSPHRLDTFTTFVAEVLHQVPRTKYANLIKAKCDKSSEFKSFYTTLRSSSFRPKIEAALKAKNILPFLSKLSSHSISASSLVPVFFELLSWGPSV